MLISLMSAIHADESIVFAAFQPLGSGRMTVNGYAAGDDLGNGVGSVLWSVTFGERAIESTSGDLPASVARVAR
jgi:hypothetical protein